MSHFQNQCKEVQNITPSHNDLIKRIMKEIEQSIKGKRKILYSDIINLIIREDYRGKMFNDVILWCNYKIRQGKYNVLIEHTKF